jgi:hypothetical protein
MKRILFCFILSILTISALADAYVHGYYRSNGTYVEPYHRTDPNNTPNDNWSTKGNVNPYTGQEGTKQPVYYQYPASQQRQYDNQQQNSNGY